MDGGEDKTVNAAQEVDYSDGPCFHAGGAVANASPDQGDEMAAEPSAITFISPIRLLDDDPKVKLGKRSAKDATGLRSPNVSTVISHEDFAAIERMRKATRSSKAAVTRVLIEYALVLIRRGVISEQNIMDVVNARKR